MDILLIGGLILFVLFIIESNKKGSVSKLLKRFRSPSHHQRPVSGDLEHAKFEIKKQEMFDEFMKGYTTPKLLKKELQMRSYEILDEVCLRLQKGTK